jgi:hypothetical protein
MGRGGGGVPCQKQVVECPAGNLRDFLRAGHLPGVPVYLHAEIAPGLPPRPDLSPLRQHARMHSPRRTLGDLEVRHARGGNLDVFLLRGQGTLPVLVAPLRAF